MEVESVILSAAEKFSSPILRQHQLSAIKSFLEGKDVFVNMPTGSGKSICYALLPWAFDLLRNQKESIAIVVSPLKALMKDQVASFAARGLSAAYAAGDTDEATLARVYNGEFQLLLVSPEMLLLNLKCREMLRSERYRSKLIAFVVDEAHCITHWGEYFRTEFSNLGEVRSLIPSSISVMALTATATAATRKKITAILGLNDPTIITSSPVKRNIYFCVNNGKNIGEVFSPLVEQLKKERVKMPRVIIYCQRCEECALIYHYFLDLLKSEFTEPIGAPNLSRFRLVDFYTGITRKDVQDTIIQSFSRADAPLRIVVCTVAFGMGVDCVGVTQVIHWGPASDIETYIQECGRAGRNGETSRAVLYQTRSSMKRVSSCMKQYCVKNDVCRRVILSSYFDSEYESVSGCACCDVCATSCSCDDCKCK